MREAVYATRSNFCYEPMVEPQLLLLLLLLMSNSSRQHSKVLYRWEVRKRGKTGKQGKVGGRESGGFSSASLPPRKREAITQGGNIEPGR